MASGKWLLATLVASCGCDTLLLVPRGEGEGEGEQLQGEGEGEGASPPQCDGEPPLWPDAVRAACEPDVDTCDRIGDHESPENDIVQIWSRADGDRFLVTIEFAGPIQEPLSAETMSIFFAFDLDRSFAQDRQDVEDPLCTQTTAYWYSRDHENSVSDDTITIVFADEAVLWMRGSREGAAIATTLPLDCASDALVGSERFFRASFPLDRVLGVDGKVFFAINTDGGGTGNLVHTTDDLAFGTCAWMESRGGRPDLDIQFEFYAACDSIIYEDGLCTSG